MTPKPTDERTALERAGDAAAALKDIFWLVGLIATGFGVYVHAVLHFNMAPVIAEQVAIRAEQVAIRAELERENRIIEELATLQVETDSVAAAEHLRQLRDLRRFSPPPR